MTSTPPDARPPTVPTRAGLGLFLRGILDFLEERGLRAQVRARVPADTAALFDDPPRTLSWVDARHIDAVEQALFELAGSSVCVELGLFAARGLGETIVQPVIRAAFFLFGEQPPAIFGHLDRFFSLTTRGIGFRWQAAADGGSIEAIFTGPDVPEAALHVLQGSLQYVFELTRTRGSVAAAVVRRQDSQSTHVSYAVDLRT
ncbi:MAG: hypothetical protein NVSMB23_05590 [Myxococcales bacterium]